MGLTYKLTEDKTAICMNEDRKPIAIEEIEGEEPKEISINAIENLMRIREVGKESKDRKEEIRAMKETFKSIIDLNLEDGKLSEWVQSSLKAIEDVGNFDQKDYVKIEQVENIKRTAQEDLSKKMEDQRKLALENEQKLKDDNEKLNTQIQKLMILDRFATSKFVKDKLNMPVTAVQRYFERNFHVFTDDDGDMKVKGVFEDGTDVLDAEDYGLADFDKALERLVDKSPDREDLLIGAKGGGSGGAGGSISPDGKNPWVDDAFNMYEQGQLIKTNIEKARVLCEQAGKTVNF